jgi:hypothetical protein
VPHPEVAWEAQDDGSYLGVPNERAREYAQGDSLRLSFAAWGQFIRSQGLSLLIHRDDCPFMLVDPDWHFCVLSDSGDSFDSFSVPGWEHSERWAAVVRIMPGDVPLAHILGVSGTLGQQQRRLGIPTPRTALLSIREILAGFHHSQGTTEGNAAFSEDHSNTESS